MARLEKFSIDAYILLIKKAFSILRILKMRNNWLVHRGWPDHGTGTIG